MDYQLPESVAVERTILGAALLDVRHLEEAADALRSEDFFLDSHRRIFSGILDLQRTGKAIDMVTLCEELNRKKELSAIGGAAYIAELTEGIPRRPSIDDYVRIVREKATAREAMAVCQRSAAKMGDQSTEPVEEVIQQAIRDLENAMMRRNSSLDLESLGTYIRGRDVLEERPPGIPTYFEKLDMKTSGLQPGELTIVAARPSMGKTSWAASLALNLGRKRKACAVFLNEQTKQSFVTRMACAHRRVPLGRVRARTLSSMELEFMRNAFAELSQFPIFWDYDPRMTAMSIRAKATRFKRGDDLEMIIVDQLSGVLNDGFWQKGMRSDEAVGMKTREMKRIASDLSVPIVVMCQLNRETKNNKDNRPGLQNLRESGSIEEVADNVIFLHRPWYYSHDDDELEKGEMIIAKARDGPIGTCAATFHAESCLWVDG